MRQILVMPTITEHVNIVGLGSFLSETALPTYLRDIRRTIDMVLQKPQGFQYSLIDGDETLPPVTFYTHEEYRAKIGEDGYRFET